jgi:hypothetical protein
MLTILRPSSKDRTEVLANESETLKACDESAWTIVNSRASMLSRSSESRMSIESSELIYKPLPFEDDLFTARVYKRNYRPRLVQRMLKPADLPSTLVAETSATPSQRSSTPEAEQLSIHPPSRRTKIKPLYPIARRRVDLISVLIPAHTLGVVLRTTGESR